MLTTPVFTRIMPESEYGLTSTFFSLQSIVEIIGTLCVTSCAANLFVQTENKRKILSTLCGLALIVTSFFAFLIIVFQRYISEWANIPETLCICLGGSLVFTQPLQIWTSYKRYIYECKDLVFITLTSTVLSSIVGAYFVVTVSATAESRIIPIIVINACVCIVICFLVFRTGFPFYDKGIWKFALGFGIPMIPHYLSQFILAGSDKLMINSMCGSKEVAIYSVAYSVGNLISLVTTAINASITPYLYEQIRNHNYKSLEKRTNQILLIVGVCLFFLMLFNREIVMIFGGVKYAESSEIIIPICLGNFFNYLFSFFAIFQVYFLHKYVVAFISVACASLNLLLNLIFIRVTGYQAAAYTTFICYLIFCIIHYLFYKRVVRIDLEGKNVYNIKLIFIISLIVVLSSVFISVFNHSLVLKYIVVLISFIILIVFRKKVNDLIEYLKRR